MLSFAVILPTPRMSSAPLLRVCLNSVDVPIVRSAPSFIDGARSSRGDVTADRRAEGNMGVRSCFLHLPFPAKNKT